VDTCWDTFGSSSDSEYESDDYENIVYDNAYNEKYSDTNKYEGYNDNDTFNEDMSESWFDHYERTREDSMDQNDSLTTSATSSNTNDEPNIEIVDNVCKELYKKPILRKRIRTKKDDRIRKRNVMTRSMMKKQKLHTASAIGKSLLERTWNDDTREFVRDLRLLLIASDQGISYKSLLSSDNRHLNTMHDIIEILNTNIHCTYMTTDSDHLNNDNDDKYSVKLDTCSNATIMRDLSRVVNASTVSENRYVSGIGGTKTPITHTGYIGNNIPTLVVPNACADILSISKCVDHDYHGTFDKNGLKLYDKYDSLVLSAGRDPNGLFACSFDDIKHMSLLTLNFTKEQIKRAEEVRSLQQRFCFPSDLALSTALSNEIFLIVFILHKTLKTLLYCMANVLLHLLVK